MVSHDENGAMGLVVNRSYGRGPLKSLLQGFGVEKARQKTPACPGGHTGTSRAPLRQRLDPRGATRGSLLCVHLDKPPGMRCQAGPNSVK